MSRPREPLKIPRVRKMLETPIFEPHTKAPGIETNVRHRSLITFATFRRHRFRHSVSQASMASVFAARRCGSLSWTGKNGEHLFSGCSESRCCRITSVMSSVNERRFIRIDELAREARVSTSTVRHWLRVGRLPSTKLGKRRVVPREAFERLVTSGTSGSSSPDTTSD